MVDEGASEKAPKRQFDPSVGKATQFKKGVCYNPGGRPKKDKAAEIAAMVFEHADAEQLRKALLKKLSKDAAMFKVLSDRAYGLMPKPVELSGTVHHEHTNLSELSDEQLAEVRRIIESSVAR